LEYSKVIGDMCVHLVDLGGAWIPPAGMGSGGCRAISINSRPRPHPQLFILASLSTISSSKEAMTHELKLLVPQLHLLVLKMMGTTR